MSQGKEVYEISDFTLEPGKVRVPKSRLHPDGRKDVVDVLPAPGRVRCLFWGASSGGFVTIQLSHTWGGQRCPGVPLVLHTADWLQLGPVKVVGNREHVA